MRSLALDDNAVRGRDSSSLETDEASIVCRAFRGIGGSGMYGLATAAFFDILPPAKWPAYVAYASISWLSVSHLGSPFSKGYLTVARPSSRSADWRWYCGLCELEVVRTHKVRTSIHVFTGLIISSVPAGVVDALLILISLPGYPQPEAERLGARGKVSTYLKQVAQRIDGPGTFMLLGAVLLLITPLQLAGHQYAWSSAAVVALLVLAILLGIAFFGWEFFTRRRLSLREPVLPSRFFSHRVLHCTQDLAYFLGKLSFTVCICGFDLTMRVIAIAPTGGKFSTGGDFLAVKIFAPCVIAQAAV